MAEVSARELGLLRLAAQRVIGPPEPDPTAVVAWLTAVQAQDLPGAVTSIALRSAGRSVEEVAAAFDAGRVVRTWPMRGTLHTVRAADAGWMVALMSPRPLAAAALRRKELGLDDAAVTRSRDLAEQALAGGGALTRAEMLAVWQAAGLPVDAGRGYHLLSHLAQIGVLCQGPVRGKEQAFVLLAEWVDRPRRLGRDEGLAELALRYLRSHGPATQTDLARWSGLGVKDVRSGVAAVADQLEELSVDGVSYLLDPGTHERLADHREQAESVHLLPGFDEMVLGYADRSMTVPPEHAERIVPGRNGVFRPTVLDAGVAVGTWRAVGTGARRRIEVEPFAALGDEVARALPALTGRLPVWTGGTTT